jgi:hypothetical protein
LPSLFDRDALFGDVPVAALLVGRGVLAGGGAVGSVPSSLSY